LKNDLRILKIFRENQKGLSSVKLWVTTVHVILSDRAQSYSKG